MTARKTRHFGGARACACVLACGLMGGMSIPARDIVLASDSAAEWNTTAANTVWTNAAGTRVAFQTGDNVLVSSASFTGPSLMMSGRVEPGDVVFDIDGTLSFGWKKNTHGLHVDTKSFTKRGAGTLLLTSALSGSAASAGGDTQYGNALTCGVEIVEGEIACKERNNWNFLGPRTVPYWVYVRDGAALSFLEGNQAGAYACPDCGIQIQLDAGGTLNHCTNMVTEARVGGNNTILCVNTLKLNGGDIVNGPKAYAWEDGKIGGKCLMYVYNRLWFSGNTPHAFGFTDEYPGYKSYSLDETLKKYKISLNSSAPVEFRVDDITGDDRVDAYVNMYAFTCGTNALGEFRYSLVKGGAGTLCFPSNNCTKAYKSDFTVKEGTVVFKSLSNSQNFFQATSTDPLQTITISTGATMRVEMRNLTPPGAETTPNIKIVVDHGTLQFVTGTHPVTGASQHGALAAKDWVFDDATLDIHNPGMSEYFGIFNFKNSAVFRGTRPLEMWPDESLDTKWQAVCVYDGYLTVDGVEDGPLTTIDVADMTGDGRTDVVMGYHIWNGATNNAARGVRHDSGFIKKGLGTFSVASMANRVSGLVIVSNGTLRVDGRLVTPSFVDVAAGAYLGGTGTVARVRMEEGSGFAAPAGQAKPLTVEGDLALPALGCVNIANLEGVDARKLYGATLVEATGTLSGTENLESWTVTLDGAAQQPVWCVFAEGSCVKVKRLGGLTVIIR